MLKTSPFLGEGDHKVKARLTVNGILIGKSRVLRLMREHGLLAPARGGQPRGGPDPQRPDPDQEAERTLGHGSVAVLDEGGDWCWFFASVEPLVGLVSYAEGKEQSVAGPEVERRTGLHSQPQRRQFVHGFGLEHA